MTAYGCLAVLSAALLTTVGATGQALQTAASADHVPTKVYADQAGKVSFRYPLAWTLGDKYIGFFGAAIAPDNAPLQAVATFDPKGNVYEKTNLTGLQFLYRRIAEPSAAACTQLVTKATGASGQARPAAVINGVRFTHISSSDAGMSKSVEQEVYATYRGGTCFLFEEDLSTIGVGVVDGERALTGAEVAALTRHLDDVMKTVTFGN